MKKQKPPSNGERGGSRRHKERVSGISGNALFIVWNLSLLPKRLFFPKKKQIYTLIIRDESTFFLLLRRILMGYNKSMQKNLVIVESPAKAKTIEKFLGKDYKVLSSYGHIRDLKKREFSINTDNFQPDYEIPEEKKKLVSELQSEAKAAETVWLASDEDREGEAISWHLYEVLGLKPENTKRIVFHEITKSAILKAIETPRHIDINLVNAQQARRVLDRIVGFKLSPVLWRKVKPALSAGRVQSVTVRLIVEREREIQAFESEASFRVTATFSVPDAEGKNVKMKAELGNRLKTKKEASSFFIPNSGHNHQTFKKVARGSLYHFHPAAGGCPQIRIHRGANHDGRAKIVRIGKHYLYAYRLGQPFFPGHQYQ